MAPPLEGRRSITTNSTLGEHSGGSTPGSLPTPQLPAASGRSKTIVDNFAQYTQAVLSTATKTIHRDSVKKRLEKQTSEADRWRKHYSGFGTMAEEQTRQLKKSEALVARSDESLKKTSEVQDRAIEGMVSSMIAAAQGKPMPVVEVDARSKHSDKEVAMMKEEFNDTRRRLDTALQDIARLNDKVSFQRSRLEDQIHEVSRNSVSMQTLTAAESKIAEATVNISKLQASSMKQTELNDKYTTIVDQVNQLSLAASDFKKANEDISRLSVNASANKIAGEILKEGVESHMKDFDKLKASVTEQMEKFVELNDYVTGNENPDEKSLTDIVKEGVEKAAKHAEALQSLNNELGELDSLKEDSKNLSVRMAKLESELVKQSSASTKSHPLPTGLDGEVAVLKEEVARIISEQQQKDEIVGEEIDQLRSLLDQKNGEVEQLRNLLDSQVVIAKDMNDQILQLRSNHLTAMSFHDEKVMWLRNAVDTQVKGINDQLLELRSHQSTTRSSHNEDIKQLRILVDDQGAVIKETNDQLLGLRSHQPTADPPLIEGVDQLRKTVDSQGVKIKEINDQLLELRSHQPTAEPALIEWVDQLKRITDSQGVMIREMNGQIMKLHSHPGVEASQTASKPSAQANVIQAPDDPVRVRIKELETSLQQSMASTWEKISNTEVFVASQEQRFNNLTTEHLARSMVNQLEKMYPNHPGNVLNELRQVKTSQHALENLLRSLETRLAEVRNFLGPNHLILSQKSTIPDLHIAIRKASDRIENVEQMHQNLSSGLDNVKGLIKDQSTNIEGLKADVNILKQDHLSAVETSKSDVQTIKADIKATETTLKADVREMGTILKANIEEIEDVVGTSNNDFQTIKNDFKDIKETTLNDYYNTHLEISTLAERIEQIKQTPSSASSSKKHPDFDLSSPASKYTTTSVMRKHKKDNRGGGRDGENHTPSPTSIPRSIQKHKKENLKPPTPAADGDSDTSLLSPSSRQRGGSVRSAATAARVKLASEAKAVREMNEAAAAEAASAGSTAKEGRSNGSVNGGTPTRKSGRKRGRSGVSNGDESDYHPMKKIGRPD